MQQNNIMTLQLSMSAILNRMKITSLRYLKYLAKWNPFALVWCLNLWFFEIMLINLYIWGCYWPRVGLKDQVNALVIADPQLTDAYSYKQSRGILLSLTEFYSDIYMKRNFARLQSSLNPSVVIFVGDLMDGGREWTDAQYINNSLNDRFYEELVRFRKVFRLRNEKTLTLGVAGNHDIGFGYTIIPYAYSRYLSTFGRLNTITTVANHSIIALDTIGLSGRPESQAYKTAHEFLQSLTLDSVGPERRILLTHVPFWRPENSECGPRRRAKPLTNRRGYQYQNFIQPDIANNVLRAIKPDLIISGDDHDDCVYVHRIDGMEITEHSVGTFSWLQGNIYPAVGVMSFRPLHAKPYSMDAKSYSLEICSLPQQLPIYYWYICLLVISLVGNVIVSYRNWNRHNVPLTPNNTFLTNLPGFLKFSWKQIMEMIFVTLCFYSLILFYLWIL
ncbi:Metallo-dependent phosphatase-like protein [Globomyces pollinis-pini]|nr:Metallo-dependent phosphatase-like protein [Globomyces pollinis-pini]